MGGCQGELLGELVGDTEGLGLGFFEGLAVGLWDVEGAALGAKGI